MIYGLTSDGTFSKDFGMRHQIQRATVSVMTNIAEGFDCESTAEFARFPGIAHRSAFETRDPQKSPPCKFNKSFLNMELDTWNLEL